jgi:hypothetical protein
VKESRLSRPHQGVRLRRRHRSCAPEPGSAGSLSTVLEAVVLCVVLDCMVKGLL